MRQHARRPGWIGEAWDPSRARYVSRSHATRPAAEHWAQQEAARLRLARPVAGAQGLVPILDRLDAYLARGDDRGHHRRHRANVEVALRECAAYCPDLADPRLPQQAQRWLAECGGKPATVCKRLAALRAYCRWLIRQRILAYDPTVPVERPRLARAQRPVPPVEHLRLIAAADTAPEWPRLALLLYCGLRSGEPALASVAGDGAALLVTGGKGQRDRWVPIPAELRDRMPTLPLPDQDRQQTLREYRRLRRRLDLPNDRTTPHSLRHAWAAWLCATGESLAIVQQWAGHSAIATTAEYTQLASAYREAASGCDRGELRLLSSRWPRRAAP